MSSSSPITGGGLKKCMPITISGRPLAAPSLAMGIEEVFDARTTSGRVTRSETGEDRGLRVQVLGGGLDREVGVRERLEVRRGSDPDERLPGRGRVELAPLDGLRDRPLDAAAAGDQELLRRLEHVTRIPARAKTSTMPEPMSPQPTTPTCRTSAGRMDLRIGDARRPDETRGRGLLAAGLQQQGVRVDRILDQ